jgi:hypothetical protein
LSQEYELVVDYKGPEKFSEKHKSFKIKNLYRALKDRSKLSAGFSTFES